MDQECDPDLAVSAELKSVCKSLTYLGCGHYDPEVISANFDHCTIKGHPKLGFDFLTQYSI
jgi:hypothetical protein